MRWKAVYKVKIMPPYYGRKIALLDRLSALVIETGGENKDKMLDTIHELYKLMEV